MADEKPIDILDLNYDTLKQNLIAADDATVQAIYNKLNEISTQLRNHVENTGDVHGTDKDDIGLGHVPNYPQATAEEAREGSSDRALMTPHTTAIMIADKSLSTDSLEEIVNAMTNAFTNASSLIKNN